MHTESIDTKDTETEALPADAAEAIARLQQGNENYRSEGGQLKIASWTAEKWKKEREELEPHQHPWAVIWGCIDSRVPPEIIFDCGLGELFVIRTAGQVPDAAGLGSLEFAVKNYESYPVKLVVVLGHTTCGAVKATVNNFNPSTPPSTEDMGSIPVLVKVIAPAYTTAKIMWRETNDEEFWTHLKAHEDDKDHVKADSAGFLEQVIHANVQNQVYQLKTNPILAAAVNAGRIQIVGAIYDLQTGTVEWMTE